jgi:hypothetical protein
MLRRALLSVMTLLTTGTAARAQNRERDGYRERVPETRQDSARTLMDDVLTVLQGNDTVQFFSPQLVALTANAIREIRASYPSVAGIGVAPNFGMHAVIFDSAALAAIGRIGRPTDNIGFAIDTLRRTGLRELDALNEQLGASQVIVARVERTAEFIVEFEKPANIPVVSRRYEGLPYLKGVGLNLFTTLDGDWILLIPKGPLFHLVFSAGYDDCPSGCLTRDYWYFTFDTVSKTVTPNGQLLGGRPRGDSIYPWDVPSSGSVAMYHSIDEVLAGAASPDWWVRRHAVLAIGYLIGNRWWPYHGRPGAPNPYNPGAEATLHAAALARWRECLLALVDRLTDAELGIAQHALEQLQEATRQRLPGGAAGQGAWRAWVESRPTSPLAS